MNISEKLLIGCLAIATVALVGALMWIYPILIIDKTHNEG